MWERSIQIYYVWGPVLLAEQLKCQVMAGQLPGYIAVIWLTLDEECWFEIHETP